MADYFKTITLTGGDVRVEGWSFDTYQANIGNLVSMVGEALTQATDDESLLGVLTPLLAKSKPLIVASLENGEDDLQKARGLADIMTLTETVIEVNGLNEVFLGKLTGALNTLTKTLTNSQPVTSSKPSSKKQAKATAN